MTAPDSKPSSGSEISDWLPWVAAFVSIATVVFTVLYSQRTLDLSRQGQIADRFSNTVELLNSEEIGGRLGGVYALEQIARESRQYRTAAKKALAGFVRVSSRKLRPSCKSSGLAQYPDIAAAVSILADQIPQGVIRGKYRLWYNDASTFVDLSSACLHAVNFEHSRLDYARLSGADIGQSAFDYASLRHARLGANGDEIMLKGPDFVAYIESISKGQLNIAGASFREADLSHADLSGIWVNRSCGPRPSLWFENATLTGVTMWQSAIPDAVFTGATMNGMTITASSFVGAQFDKNTNMRSITIRKWVNFEQADLRGVDLTGLTFASPLIGQPWPKINFRNADLRGADLRGLDLVDAEFSGADLRGAKLDSAQLSGARWDGWTLWPTGIKPTGKPAVVPSQPPPRKPNPSPAPPETAAPPPDPRRSEDKRVTVETDPDGRVRIDIASPSSTQSNGPSTPNSQSPDLTLNEFEESYNNNNYADAYPYSFTGSGNYYSDYNSLNYTQNSQLLTRC